MTTKEILNLDYRLEENKNKIQKVLKQIKPLSKYSEEIPLEVLEKGLHKICNKYHIYCNDMYLDFNSNNFIIWRMNLVLQGRKPKYIGKVFGSCIYELLAKAIILSYSEGRKKK